jgi:hypothetical protein
MRGNHSRELALPTRFIFMVLAAGFLYFRTLFPYRSLDAVGIVALRDLTTTLLHWLLILLISWGIGATIFDRIKSIRKSHLRNEFTESALGLGVVSYALLTLGLFQLLTPNALFTLQVLLSGFVAPKVLKAFGESRIKWKALRDQFTGFPRPILAIVVVSLFIGGLSFLNTLGPLWDYDGLMYHVLGPKMFLDHGGFFPQSDNWYVNGPFAIELLFSFGLPFGDEVLAKLIHFAYGVLFLGASWHLARRHLSTNQSWVTTGILLTVPTLPVWASFAYIDLGWSAYEVLAVLALVVWWEVRKPSDLILSGVFAGLAAGSKYLGLYGVALLFLFVMYISLRESRTLALRNLLTFSIPVLLLTAPWLFKNWIWLGNPVYPLFFGGEGWSSQRLELYTVYLQSFGVGRSLIDYLALPWNVYAQHEQFGAVMNRIDIPSILFPFSIFVFFKRKEEGIKALMAFAIMRFVIWSVGSQQIRFLMPIYPILAIGTATILSDFGLRMRNAWKDFPALLVGGLTLITAFYQVRIFYQFTPFTAFLGRESEDQYLSRIVKDYQAVSTIQPTLMADQKILLIGDGRGYYCYPSCLADPDHFRWAGEISNLESFREIGTWMAELDANYLLLSIEDLDFLLQHDPDNVMERAIDRILKYKEDGCLLETFRDEWTVVLTSVCK